MIILSLTSKNHLHDIQELVAKHSQGSIEEVIVRVDNANHSDNTSYETEDNESQTPGSLFSEDGLSLPRVSSIKS